MATFSLQIDAPGMAGYARTVKIADEVWADVLDAARASIVDGEQLTAQQVTSVLLRGWVESLMASAAAQKAKRVAQDVPTFEVIR